MLPALESKDHLAVLLSGDGAIKLMGVPKLLNGTGEAEATAMFNLVQEWNLADRMKFMPFDAQLPTLGSMLEFVSCRKRRWTKTSYSRLQKSYHAAECSQSI